MFWSSNVVNTLDPILDSPDKTLEQVLNDETCFEEFLAKNPKLLGYLESNFFDMLGFITNNPTEKDISAERLKIASTVSEILSYDSWAFLKLFRSDERYFQQLWSVVSIENSAESDNSRESDCKSNEQITHSSTEESSEESNNNNEDLNSSKPKAKGLNPLIASCFTKVFNALFMREPVRMLDLLWSLKAPNDFVTCILAHLNTSSIMDLITNCWENLINGNDRSLDNANRFNSILFDNQFIERSIISFYHSHREEQQENVQNMITKFISISRDMMISTNESNCVIQKIESPDFSGTLMDALFNCRSKNSFKCGFRIFQAMIRRGLFCERLSNLYQSASSTEQLDELEDRSKPESKSLTLESNFAEEFLLPQFLPPNSCLKLHMKRITDSVSLAFAQRFDKFLALLDDESFGGPLVLSTGPMDRPLGLVRLELVHLLVGLFAASHQSFLQECQRHKLMTVLTSAIDKLKAIEEPSADNKQTLATLEEWLTLTLGVQSQLLNDTDLIPNILEAFRGEDIPEIVPIGRSGQSVPDLNSTYDVAPSPKSNNDDEPMDVKEQDEKDEKDEKENDISDDSPFTMESEPQASSRSADNSDDSPFMMESEPQASSRPADNSEDSPFMMESEPQTSSRPVDNESFDSQNTSSGSFEGLNLKTSTPEKDSSFKPVEVAVNVTIDVVDTSQDETEISAESTKLLAPESEKSSDTIDVVDSSQDEAETSAESTKVLAPESEKSSDIADVSIPEERKRNFKVRPTYFGFLRVMINLLIQQNEHVTPEGNCLKIDNPEWKLFVEEKLSKLNEVYDAKLYHVSGPKIADDLLEAFETSAMNRTINSMTNLPGNSSQKLQAFDKDPFEDFDFDQVSEETGKLQDFEKVFNQRASSYFDEDDDP